MIDHPSELRRICGHDSRTVDGCVTCEAADEIERLRDEIKRLTALVNEDTDSYLRSVAEVAHKNHELMTEIERLRAENERLRGLLCKCNMRTRLVGDGCEFCNPQLAEELAKEQR